MSNNEQQSKGLIYGINDRPPLYDTLFAAIQHLLSRDASATSLDAVCNGPCR